MTKHEEDAIEALTGVVDGLRGALDVHVEHAKERHTDVLARLDGVNDTIADLRAERKRTLITVISEIGTDTVPIPFTSGRELRLRAIAGLVGLAVGSLLALGWAGPAAGWISSYVAAKAEASEPPTDTATPAMTGPTSVEVSHG